MTIDPWNEVLHDKSRQLTSDYLGAALGKVRRFGRGHDMHMFVVAHPKIPVLGKDGCYPRVDMYSISDGAMWYNKADYGWVTTRIDKSKHEIEVSVQKLKYKWMGEILPPVFFDYDKETGRFKEKESATFTLPIRSPF
jgi:hypothetical protein